MRRRLFAALMGLVGAAAYGDPTVTFSLTSSQGGAVVAPGATINWTIAFSVSTGDNLGAAAVCIDLTQDAANPTFFDLPKAAGAPASMSNFNRPAGITNPGEGGAPSGYGGSQRGTARARNLVQLGGGQNTFGQAFPPGTGVGESANVVTGVGQSGSQTLASGSFVAPSACGTYNFHIANPIANVIITHNNPPAASTVTRAIPSLSPASFAITVAPTGDVDLDFDVDISDLTQLLTGFGTTGGATLAQGDLNGDGDVDLVDLSLMLANFGTTCP